MQKIAIIWFQLRKKSGNVYIASSESLCIAANPTTKSKLFTSWRVLHMQWTLRPLKWLGAGSNRTLGELRFGHACETLEIVMARVTEVGGTKAKVDSH